MRGRLKKGMACSMLAVVLGVHSTHAKATHGAPFIFQFGPEFTFSNSSLLDSFVAHGSGQQTAVIQTAESILAMDQLKNLWKQQVVDPAPETWKWMKVHDPRWDRYKLHLIRADGFGIVAFSDPGVIEVNHSPITVANAEKEKRFFQKTIFGGLKHLALTPMAYAGSGHIHMDLKGFRGDLRIFRDFLVDFHNYPGLAMGGLNHDIYNAVALAQLPQEQKNNFREIIGRVDTGQIDSIAELVRELIAGVFGPIAHDPLINRSRAQKYHATSFAPSYSRFGTIEIRCIRPQSSYQSFLHQIRLFESRVNMLAERRASGHPPVPVGMLEPVNAQGALTQFNAYVSEAGLNFQDYQPMVLDWWQGPGGELQNYLDSREEKSIAQCSGLARGS